MVQTNIVKTMKELNETTGRILLQRVYLCIQPVSQLQAEDKLTIIKTIHDSVNNNMYKESQDFFIDLWTTFNDINKQYGSPIGELKEFTTLLNEIIYVLKLRTKGNTNESVNN